MPLTIRTAPGPSQILGVRRWGEAVVAACITHREIAVPTRSVQPVTQRVPRRESGLMITMYQTIA